MRTAVQNVNEVLSKGVIGLDAFRAAVAADKREQAELDEVALTARRR